MLKLLILDDDPDILEALKAVLEADDTELLLERTGNAAIACVRNERPNVALVDINLPGKTGLDVLREIKNIDSRVCVVMMSGYQTTQNAIEAMKFGAFDYLTKPLDINQLQTVIKKAFQSSLLNRGIRIVADQKPLLPDEGENDVMIGSSPEMIEIWKMIGKIAESDATVLVQGESGTGKELLARAVFNNSLRKNKPFLAVNCAALPENLLESELFGHEKGAFTDASRRHIGRFEQCHGGTIFLDEIAEMSLKNQAKMLRVLENQEFERVGGSEVIKADVRIIAATNQSLISAVKEKRFRIDLFYRLRVVNIFLPPLRERVEDIPLLAHHFLRKFSKENRKPMMNISDSGMKLLTANSWPGNIRELKNVLNSAIVVNRGTTLLPEDLSPLLNANTERITPAASPGDIPAQLKSLFNTLALTSNGRVFEAFIAEVEKTLFQLTMEQQAHNEVHAAKFLGISRNTLRSRLKSYGIHPGS